MPPVADEVDELDDQAQREDRPGEPADEGQEAYEHGAVVGLQEQVPELARVDRPRQRVAAEPDQGGGHPDDQPRQEGERRQAPAPAHQALAHVPPLPPLVWRPP